MEIINSKYYKGFEGEGEIQFIRYLSNGDTYILQIWGGYFDEIMRQIEPEEDGWTGFAYHYNVEDPWWEQSWKVPDIDIVLDQLQKIKSASLSQEAKELLLELCKLLSSSKELNEAVWIAGE